MEPETTPARPPRHVQIADDIRIEIEKGQLAPGDPLPTRAELADTWDCSTATVRQAMALLRSQGLISGGRGKPLVVRMPPRPTVRDAARHQAEKDVALLSEAERREHGEAEDVLGVPLSEIEPRTEYRVIPAPPGLAAVFGVPQGTELLRKQYEKRHRSGWVRLLYSVSWVPVDYIRANPALLAETNEPWPGGAQHQFRTVGIEIATMIDEVTAVMPTTVDAQRWALDDGVPLLTVRRISVDTDGRVVEVSDAQYPADRALLRFTSPLRSWVGEEKCR
jgi:GntR family transcriptional regulator